jgi:RNA recognition motif-containing protein
MPSIILITNLPPDVTEEELRQLFAQRGNESVVNVEFEREGNPDNIIAKVQMDIDSATARIMAEKAQGIVWKGRKISFYVPLNP